MTKQITFGWDTINTAIDTLAYQLEPLKPLGIVAVARGGLIPATMLSHRMNNTLVFVINAKSYDDKSNVRGHSVFLSIESGIRALIMANPSRYVIVDDILDSGHTYDAIKQELPVTTRFTCLVTKRPLLPVTHFAQVPHDVWVKFPWE